MLKQAYLRFAIAGDGCERPVFVELAGRQSVLETRSRDHDALYPRMNAGGKECRLGRQFLLQVVRRVVLGQPRPREMQEQIGFSQDGERIRLRRMDIQRYGSN